MGSEAERRAKLQRRYSSRELPFHHDMLRELDIDPNSKEARAIREYMRVEQANFDHLSAEFTRYASIYNEKEADTEYIKDGYQHHMQESTGTQTESIQRDETWNPCWHSEVNLQGEGGDTSFEESLNTQPFFAGENMHVTAIGVHTGEDGATSPDPTDPNTRMHVGIYAGDNPGNAPGSLMEQAALPMSLDGDGVTFEFATGDPPTYANRWYYSEVDVVLRKGQWYWVAFIMEPEVDLFNFFPAFFDPSLNSTAGLEGAPTWISHRAGPMWEALDSATFVHDLAVIGWSYFSLYTFQSAEHGNGSFPEYLPFNVYDSSGQYGYDGPYYDNIGIPLLFLRTA